MDSTLALTVSASILAVIQAINSTNKVLLHLAKASEVANDHRYDGLYWRLFSERTSTETLLKRIEFGGRPIPPEHDKTFKQLCSQISSYYTAVEHSLDGIIPENGKITIRSFARRLKFEQGGFEDLREKLDSIEAMNRALKILGETLPEYTGPNNQPISGHPNVQVMDSIIPNQSEFPLEEDDGQRQVQESAQVVAHDPGRVKIASLVRVCIAVLKDLTSVPSLAKRTSGILARIEMWSVGFIQSEIMPMDALFKLNGDSNEPLRQFLLESLVDIGVAEDVLLKALTRIGDDTMRLWQKHRSSILATLAKSELFDFAAKRWAELSNEYEEIEEEPDRGKPKFVDNLTGDHVNRIPENTINNLQKAVAFSLDDIEVIVDSIYAVTPALRSLRRSYILDLEAASQDSTLPQATGSTIFGATVSEVDYQTDVPVSSDLKKQQKPVYTLRVVNAKAPQNAIFDETMRSIKELEEALRKDEEFAEAEAHEIAVFSPQLHEQRVQLERHFRNQNSGEKGVSSKKADAVSRLNHDVKATVDAVMLFENPENGPVMNNEERDQMVTNLIEEIGKVNSILLT